MGKLNLSFDNIRKNMLTTQFPNYKPYYIFLTLLSNGIFNEETNISNGQSTAELGSHLVFGTRTGYYQCPNASYVHLTDFGYIFKNSELSVFTNNGALIIQDYNLYFAPPNYTTCTGQLNAAFYPTGSDPFENQTQPIYSYPIRNLTCELLSGRHYVWPPGT
ncbi:unnamed protein product [Adineta steineri]|uniref:Uncharacterized protein n=1 Tax=Adineta steineri TaxID=433720 RepID=A0A819Q559_9BILA|nr:unnamed protein product [Adineta steineri]CAF4009541.1 unnamed protein product [Adineta steineri]CAF4023791.1 unnamed protein product [Adineta steineri]